MRLALDTNVLAYAEGVNGEALKAQALGLLRALPAAAASVPVQALGELFHVLVRKAGRSKQQARLAILSRQDAYPLISTTPPILLKATDLCADHQCGTWDAIMMAGAVEAGCRLLLSEAMQDGFSWGGVTIVNPFLRPFSGSRHPLLASMLQQGKSAWPDRRSPGR